MTDQLFMQPSSVKPVKEQKRFGHVYNGRYHMPLLAGENGTKAGGDYVPRGVMRTTNFIGAITDTRALSRWEQEQTLLGLVRDPSLYEELCLLIHQGDTEGVDYSRLRDFPRMREAMAGIPFDSHSHERSLIGRAKHAAGANLKRQMGTNRHTAWEHRGATGELIGTPAIQSEIGALEPLLQQAGLVRVPHLSERVVRHPDLGVVGKFDDVLLELATGRLLMSDLKTKQRDFFTMLELDAQLGVYSRCPWMLNDAGTGYEEGPVHHVDQNEGVILHMPSDGAPPALRRVDLNRGWRIAELCAMTLAERAYADSAERMSQSYWVPQTS